MGFFTIRKKFIPLKLHYLLFNAGTCVQNIMPVYSKVFGFSPYVIGVIYTILPLVGLFIKPAFGALADRMKWHRGVLISWVFLTTAGFFSIWFLPTLNDVPSSRGALRESSFSICGGDPPYFSVISQHCTITCPRTHKNCENWAWPEFCQDNSYHQLSMLSNSSWSGENCVALKFPENKLQLLLSDSNCTKICGYTAEVSDSETFASWNFWVYVLLLIFGWAGISVSTTLTDTICIEICGDWKLYGKQRLWASIGWGGLSMIIGFVIDAVSVEGEEKNYLPAFLIMLPPLIVDFILCFKLKISIPAKSESIAKDVWKVVVRPRVLFFIFLCTAFGASLGLVWNFLFLYLEELAAVQGAEVVSKIKTIEGLVSGIETFIGEIPILFFAGWIVDKLGHGHSMSLILLLIGIRYTLYSLLVNPWWCLPIEILQNNYGLFYPTMTSYAKKIAPPGTEATIQSLVCGCCEGIGIAIGSYIAGLLYNSYGGSNTFLIFGIAFAVLAICNEAVELLYKVLDRKSENYGLSSN